MASERSCFVCGQYVDLTEDVPIDGMDIDGDHVDMFRSAEFQSIHRQCAPLLIQIMRESCPICNRGDEEGW